MIDIIIVNWNSGSLLFECIKSIYSYGSFDLIGKVIVVDNASSDNSLELISSFSDVELIRSQKNLGFGRACNLGAQKAKQNFLLFLNPDALLYKNSLQYALNFFKQKNCDNVGVVGIKLIDEQQHTARSCARFPSLWMFIAHAVGLNRLKSFKKHNMHMDDWDHESTRDVDHVIGAFYLIRRSLFESLNGFDERFFVYLEDLDLSYRVREQGWRIVYLAEAQAFHAGGGSSRKVKAHRLFYSLRSRLFYGFKHFSLTSALVLLIFTLLVEPITRFIFSLIHDGFSGVKNTAKAYFWLWADLINILAKVK